MSRSNGNYTAPSSSWNPAVEGTTVDEADWNALLDDIEAALTESVYTGGLGPTDNQLVRTDGTDTKKVQGTGITVDDSNNVTGVGGLSATTIELGHASDTTISRTSAGDIAIEGNAVYRTGGTDVALADGGTGASLSDPNADRILFWDDSAGGVTWLEVGSGLTFTGTTLTVAGAGTGDVVGPNSATDNAIVRFDTSTGKLIQDSVVTIDDTTGKLTGSRFGNSGLKIEDTNASHLLTVAPGSDLTADRTFTITTGDTDRTLNLSAGSMAPTTAGLAVVEAANATAQTALFDAVVGDSGAGGTKGMVPAPAAGDAAANKFLKADGTWTAPSGSGDVVGPASSTSGNIPSFADGTGKLLADSGVVATNIYRSGGTDVAVADGGTGRSSHTAYAVVCGGTTDTSAQQSIASVGTSGQVLTSNGASALPTFQTLVTTAASQAEQEAASSTSVAVTPGRQHYHPSAAKAWAYVTYSGGTPSAQSSYGVSSLTDSGTGHCRVNFSTAFSSAYYVICAASYNTSNFTTVYNVSTTIAAVYIFTIVSPTLTDGDFSVMCFGDQ